VSLSRVEITAVRNLEQVKLQGLQQVNLFYGANGSGKTSVLESIHLLAMARSFRGTRVATLIRHGQQSCIVFGTVHPGQVGPGQVGPGQVGPGRTSPGPTRQTAASAGGTALGVQRSLDGDTRIRIAGTSVRSVGELAAYLPVQVINADSFGLLTGAPAARRQYLDWGVFHVEHSVFDCWQRFQRCIKQRNNLLRRGKMSAQELVVWTRELAVAGEELAAMRQRYHDELLPIFRDVVVRLVPELGEVELRLRRGWDREHTYHEALDSHTESDQAHGFTHVGPQRADIRVLAAGRPAADTLSRGQQKLVVCAMKLAQGRLLTQRTGRQCVYLVDDLPSELDRDHAGKVCEELGSLGAQVFITCVDKQDVLGVWPSAEALAVFHVEHGQIRAETTRATLERSNERS
jgi:DNA replication and repair protein RecF